MSTVGDVVFCVDCDLARSAHVIGATAAADGKAEQLPRRMATKKDANGDALCTPCLDVRLQRRRAAFELRQVAQAPATPAVRPQIVHTPVRKLSEVRITRVRPAAEAENTANGNGNANGNGKRNGNAHGNGNGGKRVAPAFDRDRELRFIAEHVAKAPDRKLERAFLELSAAIGFLRAQELLGKLRSRALAITGRAR